MAALTEAEKILLKQLRKPAPELRRSPIGRQKLDALSKQFLALREEYKITILKDIGIRYEKDLKPLELVVLQQRLQKLEADLQLQMTIYHQHVNERDKKNLETVQQLLKGVNTTLKSAPSDLFQSSKNADVSITFKDKAARDLALKQINSDGLTKAFKSAKVTSVGDKGIKLSVTASNPSTLAKFADFISQMISGLRGVKHVSSDSKALMAAVNTAVSVEPSKVMLLQ